MNTQTTDHGRIRSGIEDWAQSVAAWPGYKKIAWAWLKHAMEAEERERREVANWLRK